MPVIASEPKTSAPTDQPLAGHIYLQLIAAAQAHSNLVVGMLHNNGLPAITAEVPEQPGLYRVLIEEELEATRAKLNSVGFPGNSAMKRVY